MLPQNLYKRRHYGTPGSFYLMGINYLVLVMAIQMFGSCTVIGWDFWIMLAPLVVYNIYKIRRDREEYDKIRIIAYIISVVGMVIMFFLFRSGARHC